MFNRPVQELYDPISNEDLLGLLQTMQHNPAEIWDEDAILQAVFRLVARMCEAEDLLFEAGLLKLPDE